MPTFRNYTKKVLLAIVAFTLLAGNSVRIIQSLSGNPTLSISYAQVDLTTDFMLPPQSDYSYLASKNASIDQRIADISVDQVKVRRIERYLGARGAPLAAHAETFVRTAERYNLPYNLMPAISVVESNGGKYNYRPYNYAGMGGQGNAITFSSYEEAIDKHAQILRYGYFDAGADTPAEIAPYYCPPCTTWHTKVESVMYAIDQS